MFDRFRTLKEIVDAREVELGRGEVISQLDLEQAPGTYPVYSSSAQGSGEFGRYGRFMFDEELITWSVDGGGRPFYRSKHRFSVTNVCGFLRIRARHKWNYRYLHAVMALQHAAINFDYQTKAHPSVIQRLYRFAPIPITEQEFIAAVLDTVEDVIVQTQAVIAKLKQVRAGLLHDLLARGLDEHGQLRDPIAHPEQFRDSPLGRVPKEWQVNELAECYQIPSKNGLYKKASFYGSGIRMVHMPQMFVGSTIDISNAARVSLDSQELQHYSLEEGDLLFARRSLNLEGAGLCCMISALAEPATFESSIVRVRLKRDQLEPRFAVAFLRSPLGYILRRRFIRQVAVSGVSGEDISHFLLPRPNCDEQNRILAALDVHDSELTALESEWGKLHHLKSGLMTDLLTGCVRVPEHVGVGGVN